MVRLIDNDVSGIAVDRREVIALDPCCRPLAQHSTVSSIMVIKKQQLRPTRQQKDSRSCVLLTSSNSKEVSQWEGPPKIALIVGIHLAATDLQSYIGAACNFATERGVGALILQV